jgi:hypothetical protein
VSVQVRHLLLHARSHLRAADHDFERSAARELVGNPRWFPPAAVGLLPGKSASVR